MNYSKLLNIVLGVMAAVGFFLMIGSVGAMDFADEIGLIEPWNAHLGTGLVGVVFIIPGIIRWHETEQLEEEGDED